MTRRIISCNDLIQHWHLERSQSNVCCYLRLQIVFPGCVIRCNASSFKSFKPFVPNPVATGFKHFKQHVIPYPCIQWDLGWLQGQVDDCNAFNSVSLDIDTTRWNVTKFLAHLIYTTSSLDANPVRLTQFRLVSTCQREPAHILGIPKPEFSLLCL